MLNEEEAADRREYYRSCAVPPQMWRVPIGDAPGGGTWMDWAMELAASVENNSILLVPDTRPASDIKVVIAEEPEADSPTVVG